MEELDFFEEICLTSLYATKESSLAVVDSNGKMVTGKIRRIHGHGHEGPPKWLTVLNGQEEVTHFITII